MQDGGGPSCVFVVVIDNHHRSALRPTFNRLALHENNMVVTRHLGGNNPSVFPLIFVGGNHVQPQNFGAENVVSPTLIGLDEFLPGLRKQAGDNCHLGVVAAENKKLFHFNSLPAHPSDERASIQKGAEGAGEITCGKNNLHLSFPVTHFFAPLLFRPTGRREGWGFVRGDKPRDGGDTTLFVAHRPVLRASARREYVITPATPPQHQDGDDILRLSIRRGEVFNLPVNRAKDG